VADDLWLTLGRIANEQNRSVSALVLDALKRYVIWYQRGTSENE
jgi:hypothetical protein